MSSTIDLRHPLQNEPSREHQRRAGELGYLRRRRAGEPSELQQRARARHVVCDIVVLRLLLLIVAPGEGRRHLLLRQMQ